MKKEAKQIINKKYNLIKHNCLINFKSKQLNIYYFIEEASVNNFLTTVSYELVNFSMDFFCSAENRSQKIAEDSEKKISVFGKKGMVFRVKTQNRSKSSFLEYTFRDFSKIDQKSGEIFIFAPEKIDQKRSIKNRSWNL